MKYFPIVFFFFASLFVVNGQTYEIGGMIGAANYIGDVGATDYINPSTLAVGGILKWNRSPRHSFRATLMVAKIKGDDADSKNSRRQQRGYDFSNVVKELSVGLEYTFWEFDVHNGRSISTPYLYTGLTVLGYNALSKNESNKIRKYDNAVTMAIPMVVGYKSSVGRFAKVGFEIGARYTFTDNLDGSNPTGSKDKDESLKFGNINSNDWYVFTGITVTFAFGRKPCYCNF